MEITTKTKRRVLCVGIASKALEALCAQSKTIEWDIRETTGAVTEYPILCTEKYDDLIVDIEGCESYAPALVTFLEARSCLSEIGMRVAIGEWFIDGLRYQLEQSGFCTLLVRKNWPHRLRDEFCDRKRNAA